MKNNIQQQLNIIEKSNTWIASSLDGDKQLKAYRKMVNFRRQLTRKMNAIEGNPAAAIYGESQAGKSYLVSSLLSETGKPFKIVDGKGNEFDFKNKINPRGNEMESTSVVTRFSTNYKSINLDFPIIAKLLSPTDIILVICEAFYNNLKVNKPLSFDEIKDKISSFERLYANKAECQKFIIEDDIWNIQDYFNDNFSRLVYNNIKDANFFEKISALITRIAPEEWKDVFSLFWNFNPQLTKLFDDLIGQYKQFNFAKSVFLPIEAVLRSKGTILDVSRLDEIYDSFKGQEAEYSSKTAIFFLDNNGNEKIIEFPKSYLCALTAELIFVLPEIIKNDKPFLGQTDLLDFPGTRRFESTSEDSINDKSLTVLLRRGKVDYLFNKYSNDERINTLLFCQNHKQSNQSVIPEKLNRWIGNMIGRTKDERENFKSPIPPLFVISTWFNKELEFDKSNDRLGDIQSFNERWNQRFIKTLENEIFKIHEYSWLVEWSISSTNFQNIFLLRDFEKSGTNTQNCSNIFKGYHECNKETEEIIQDSYPNFRKDLRQSFVEFPFVKRHFANPTESWDRAASMNEDGSKLIIEKLSIAADNINAARFEKMQRELSDISINILAELNKYFHSNDKDQELQKAKSKAGDIQFKMNTAFSADGIKRFGHLMQELMITESEIFELFRNIIENIEHREIVNLAVYNTHRERVPVLDGDTTESYFERLATHYEKTTDEEKSSFRLDLEKAGVDLDVLINSSSDLVKNNAQQLADGLLEYWFNYITLNDKQTIHAIFNTVDTTTLHDLVEMYQKLFKKLDMSKIIADKIRKYVSNQNKADFPYEIVADISSELLNKCINTVGFEYLDASEIKELKEANEKNRLGLDFDEPGNEDEDVEKLLYRVDHWSDIIRKNPLEMRHSANYQNYISWYNRLKIGFVSVCDIPNYDLNANNKLKEIIDECTTIKY